MKLLVLLLGLLVLSPLLEEFFKLRVLEGLFFTAIFIYAAYSFSRSKALVAAAVSLAVPAIVLFWIKPFVSAQWVEISGGLCGTAFVAIIIVAILHYIFLQQDVSADLIAGAIVAYLLMALMWSLLYGVLEAAASRLIRLADRHAPDLADAVQVLQPRDHHHGRLWRHYAGHASCQGVCQPGGRGRSTLPGDPGLLAGGNVRVQEIEVNVPAPLTDPLNARAGAVPPTVFMTSKEK